MAEITIRQALATDIPFTVHIELAAHSEHPIIALPWKQYSHKYAAILSRQLNFINFPNKYQYLVATVPSAGSPGEEEIVGYLVGSTPKNALNGVGGEEHEDWKPIHPEGTNVSLVRYFFGKVHENAQKFKSEDMWGMYFSFQITSFLLPFHRHCPGPDSTLELETLSISVNHQRMGVGSKLMDEWLKTVDADGRAMYILSSKKGKGLYEKLGAKQVDVLEIGLKDFGVEEPYRLFNMVREGKKV